MKAKKFEELSETQKAAFHNMDTRDLFVLHDALKKVVRWGVCKPKIEVCKGCPIKSMCISKTGWGGPMACSLIALEAASRGRYTPVATVEVFSCDQCGMLVHPPELHVDVPQFGYRTLKFCMRCVEMSQA